ncbi:MAG: SDR family oxidoreductase [Planktomarina sp.]|jgi:2-keto-3-deoxy-L-fuconate dehydrogenase|nr:SDR family oxidoreductase [Planktomarina sp.]MDT2074239.1 SDR family oxidoreductase [Planktomarina sp.]MDT2077865.1 SDR family oxidoreductase [Planktomarina sp.]|tara:strand:- start:3137 stop:3865 length:729 start_codon:yes stop_codon:yes gene_type:complete
MKRLAGKTVLATASGAGIGLSTVLRMRDEGARVIATDINTDQILGIDGLDVRQLDVTDSAAISAVIGDIGQIDILFNCAGFVHSGSILEASEDELDFAFNLNVKAMFHTIRAVLPGMLAVGSGSIVNMASVASSIKGVPNRFAYTATKAAVIGLTKSVAADYVTRGIRCNAICPGTVDSPSLHARLKATGDFEKAMKEFVDRQPMGRVGAPEEIAALAVYLASDEAKFTTGTTHVIDGGWVN